MAEEKPQVPISALPEFKSTPDGFFIPGYKGTQPTSKADLGKMIDQKTKQALAQTQQQVADINRDMGKYQQLPDVTLALVESGKRIDKDGKFVADSNWNVGRLGAVSKGNIYELLMGGSDKMVLGTALFVSHTVERIGGADTDVYTPIFSAVNVDLPISTYAVLLAGEDYADVLVSYRADVAGANTMRVSRWGIFASVATQLANLKKQVDLKSFADGYYDNMGVGYAKNLIGDGETTTEQFTERVAGGSHQIDDSIAEYSLIKGNSVIWNQLNKKQITETNKGITQVSTDDGITTINGTAETDVILYNIIDKGAVMKNLPNGHKGLFVYLVISGTFNGVGFWSYGNSSRKSFSSNTEFIHNSDTPYEYLLQDIKQGDTFDNLKFRFQVFDLTQMFGAGNEPTIEQFRQWFPNDYYPYNEGTIVNMTAEGVKTTGRNLWKKGDSIVYKAYIAQSYGNWETSDDSRSIAIPCEPNTKYYIKPFEFTSTILRAATISTDIPAADRGWGPIPLVDKVYSPTNLEIEITTSSSARFLIVQFGSSYESMLDKLYIGISRASVLEPHVTSERKWSETMAKCFPDGMAKIGNVYDEMGATKAVQRIGVVDLGAMNWSKVVDSKGQARFSGEDIVGSVQIQAPKQMPNIVNSKYPVITQNDSYIGAVEQGIAIFSSKPYVTDVSYTDAASFKAAMQGKYLYYELAEPIVTTYDELNLTSRVWRNGMESIIVPEGKESSPINADVIYQINAFKAIKQNKANIEELNAKPAIGLTAEEVAKIRELIKPSSQSLEEE